MKARAYTTENEAALSAHGSFANVAKLTKRDRSTDACYASEYEVAVRTVNCIKNA